MSRTEIKIKSGGKTTYTDFLNAFGYDDVHARLFADNKEKCKRVKHGKKIKCKVLDFESKISEIDYYNQNDSAGVFFVVNGNGDEDDEVLASGTATAQFIDIDNKSKEEQKELLSSCPLRPSIIIESSKSYHAYWLLKDGDIKSFRKIQIMLADYFGADYSCQNESRVMRLPNFYHNKSEPFMVELVWFHPELKYTQNELIDVLREKSGTGIITEKTSVEDETGKPIAQGDRHRTFYIMACRLIDDEFMRQTIINALYTEDKYRCSEHLPVEELAKIVDCAYKYKKGEAGKMRYIKKKRSEVIEAYED